MACKDWAALGSVDAEQKSLLDEMLDEDLQAVADEIAQVMPPIADRQEKQVPKRAPLPANLPRRGIRHQPGSTPCPCGCQMKRVGEDMADKLAYVPGVFTVERRIRGKWACAKCETSHQVPVAPHIIDKGLPTTGLLAQEPVSDALHDLITPQRRRVTDRSPTVCALDSLLRQRNSSRDEIMVSPVPVTIV